MCVTSGTATRTLWCSQALREEIMSNLPLQDLRPSSNITATISETPSVIVSANNNNKSQPCYLVFLSVREPRCTPVLRFPIMQLLFSLLDSLFEFGLCSELMGARCTSTDGLAGPTCDEQKGLCRFRHRQPAARSSVAGAHTNTYTNTSEGRTGNKTSRMRAPHPSSDLHNISKP